MKSLLQSAFFFACYLAVLYPGSALKCLKCFSYTSTQDCSDRMSSVTCDKGFDRCSNTTVEIYSEIMKETLVAYQLDCAKDIECRDKTCARHFGIHLGVENYRKCVISCCQDDLCPYSPNITTLRPPSENENGNDVGGPAKGARGGVGKGGVCSSMLGMIIVTVLMVIS